MSALCECCEQGEDAEVCLDIEGNAVLLCEECAAWLRDARAAYIPVARDEDAP